jgi:hypothetical protein
VSKKGGIFTLDELIALHRSLWAHEEELGTEKLVQLQDLIGREVIEHKWTKDEKDDMRWAVVREGLDLGRGWTRGLDSAFQYASDKLAGHPAATGPAGMEASYKEVQARLRPCGQHRKPTWRKRRK